MKEIAAVDVIDNGGAIEVRWRDGGRSRFHAVWLRDNAPDPGTRSPVNGQRLITLAEIPRDVAISEAHINADGTLAVDFSPESKRAEFAAAFLASRDYDHHRRREPGWIDASLSTRDAALGESIPRADFETVAGDREALAHWLAGIRRFGVGLLEGGPPESGALCRVVERFGYIRETNYGRWFEVRSEIDPSNLAYTGLGLQAHTDNPYRDPVPTLQLLYCLENSADGGDSLVVDGFSVARRLCDESPRLFTLLTRYCARFEYAGSAGVRLRARRPVIELAPDGELVAVRFNNRSAAAVIDVPYDDMPAYYDALRRFGELIDDAGMAVRMKLEPGQCLIMDNTRVLHARTAFTGGGSRWLQGCYADKDGLLSTLAAYETECGIEAA